MCMIRLHQLLPYNIKFCVHIPYIICGVNTKEWNIDIALCEQLPIRMGHIKSYFIVFISPT